MKAPLPIFTALLLAPLAAHAGEAPSLAGPLHTDTRELVSQADLICQGPAVAPVQGQPIGNGSIGTLVWTTPSVVHLQINRNDVLP